MVIELKERLIKILQREVDELREENDELRKRMYPTITESEKDGLTYIKLSFGDLHIARYITSTEQETKQQLLEDFTKDIKMYLNVD